MKQAWLKYLLLTLVVGGVLLNLLTIMPSGSHYCFDNACGVYFWGANEHDGVWHLAVANTLLDQYPYQLPNMSGVTMHGYNYLLDLVVAVMSKISLTSSSVWIFKIIPLLWAGLFVWLSGKFARSYLPKRKYYPYLVMIMGLLGSSLGYLIVLLKNSSLKGASTILAMQAGQNLLNPQFALSLVVILLYLIKAKNEPKNLRDYMWRGDLVAVAITLKFYTGIVMGVMMAAEVAWDWVGGKVGRKLITLGSLVAGSLVIAASWFFYQPGHAAFPLIYKPWATVNPVVEDSSLVYLPQLATRIYSYQGAKLWIIEAIILGIFTLFNYGSRVIAVFAITKVSHSRQKFLIIVGSLAGLLLSILLVQRGVWWNTVQFLYVSMYLAGLLSAEVLADWLDQGKLIFTALALIVVALNLPGNWDIATTYIHKPGTSYISDDQLSALRYLRDQPKGAVLTPPFSRVGGTAKLSGLYDTAMIPAYSYHPSYLSDVVQLDLTQTDYQGRKSLIDTGDCGVLSQVKYIWDEADNPVRARFVDCPVKLEQIFDNSEVVIWQVN